MKKVTIQYGENFELIIRCNGAITGTYKGRDLINSIANRLDKESRERFENGEEVEIELDYNIRTPNPQS